MIKKIYKKINENYLLKLSNKLFTKKIVLFH